MRPLSDAQLLDLWDHGAPRAPLERALLLLAAAAPSCPAEALLSVTIPERDRAVLDLRRATFGSGVAGVISCPSCGERLEFSLDVATMPAGAEAAPGIVTIANGLRFRLPNSLDLRAAALSSDADSSAAVLLRRCCLDADAESAAGAGAGDEAVSRAAELGADPGLLAEVERAMAELAGVADIQLALACAACGHAWDSALDICAFFWEEIEQRAQLVLDEVHRLAAAYGWDEQAILAMSSARRAAYLQRCAS
jgi:hypothetical protein